MNSKQYKLLKYAADHPDETYKQITLYAGENEASYNRRCLDELYRMEYVHFWANPDSLPIQVTGLGLEALEEYESAQRSEQREDESLEAVKRELELHRREIKHTIIWSAINSVLTVVSIGISLYSIFHG